MRNPKICAWNNCRAYNLYHNLIPLVPERCNTAPDYWAWKFCTKERQVPFNLLTGSWWAQLLINTAPGTSYKNQQYIFAESQKGVFPLADCIRALVHKEGYYLDKS